MLIVIPISLLWSTVVCNNKFLNNRYKRLVKSEALSIWYDLCIIESRVSHSHVIIKVVQCPPREACGL